MSSRHKIRWLHYCLWLFLGIINVKIPTINALTSLAKNDPYPMYSSIDPQTFLYMKERLEIKDPPFATYKIEDWGIIISPYGENANNGRDIYGRDLLPTNPPNDKVPVPSPVTPVTPTGQPIELGDITGRINMIALLYGCPPQGQSLPPALLTAKSELFPDTPIPIDDNTYIDEQQLYASFTAPIKYRRRGIRFDLYKKALCNFGINIQTGIASQTQTAKLFDVTCAAQSDCPFNFTLPATEFTTKVETLLMHNIKTILHQLHRKLENCTETSIEEIRCNAYWRQAYDLNEDRNIWPHFLIMPWVEAGVSVSPGRKMCTNQVFDAAFGNNGHTAMGMSAGLNFDFIETVEVGLEVGATYFFGRTVSKLPIPNNKYQKTLFPFTSDAKVYPGYNWNFGVKLSAYHFLDNLSLYFEYILVNHQCDRIRPIDCCGNPLKDCAFKPYILEKTTGFKSALANIALNYDLSPNILVGLLWQAPCAQHNSYKTSTLLASFSATF